MIALNLQVLPLNFTFSLIYFPESMVKPAAISSVSPGNIPDVKTLKKLLADPDVLGYSKVKLVTSGFTI
jgi:hypothetical protein